MIIRKIRVENIELSKETNLYRFKSKRARFDTLCAYKRIQISSTSSRGPYAINEGLLLNRGNDYRTISQKWTRLLFIANLDRGSYNDRNNGHCQYPIQIRTGCWCRGTASSFLAKVIQRCCLINLFHGKKSGIRPPRTIYPQILY